MNREGKSVTLVRLDFICDDPAVTFEAKRQLCALDVTSGTVELSGFAVPTITGENKTTVSAADDTRRSGDHVERVAVTLRNDSLRYPLHILEHIYHEHRAEA